MKIYFYYSPEETEYPDKNDWTDMNLCIPLKTNSDDSVEADIDCIFVSFYGRIKGWSKINYDDELRLWPHKLPAEALREFIEAIFSGEAK
jgi:hypothetical protein